MDILLVLGFLLPIILPIALYALKIILKVKKNTFHILWESEDSEKYKIKMEETLYLRRPSQPFETIEIGQANTLGKINIQPDRIFLDTMVSVVTSDFVRFQLGIKVHLLKTDNVTELVLLRHIPSIEIITTEIIIIEIARDVERLELRLGRPHLAIPTPPLVLELIEREPTE